MMPMPMMGSMGAPGGGTPRALGPELVVNGGFDDGAAWTVPATSAISGGLLNITAGVAGVVQASNTGAAVANNAYEVSFEIISYVSGSVSAGVQNGGAGTARSAAGVFRETLTPTLSGQIIVIARTGGFTGTVDNVSVRLVL